MKALYNWFRSVCIGKISLATLLVFLAIPAMAAFIPFEWDAVESADYYVVEFTNDPSFNEIIMIYRPKTNRILLNVQKGTYYLKVTAILKKGKNSRPSQVVKIVVDDKGNVKTKAGKKKYPSDKKDGEKADPIQIIFQEKNVAAKKESSEEEEKDGEKP